MAEHANANNTQAYFILIFDKLWNTNLE